MLDFGRLKSQRSALASAIKAQDEASVASLLKAEFMNLNYLDEAGNTPLHTVACSGNLAIASLLVRHGAVHNIQNRQGFFPIHLASFYGHVELMVFLLDSRNFADQACLVVEDDQQQQKKKASRRLAEAEKQNKRRTLALEDERRLLVESESEDER